jgi:ABC-2 type transport system ATP-binding protein
MIESQNLTKQFGDRTVVNDVSFRVEPGTVAGFLGANGAGKTTTLRMLTGLAEPDGGRRSCSGAATATSRTPVVASAFSWTLPRSTADGAVAKLSRSPRS